MLLYNSHLSICMATGKFFALYLRYKAEMFGEDSYAICASTQKLFFSVCLFKKKHIIFSRSVFSCFKISVLFYLWMHVFTLAKHISIFIYLSFCCSFSTYNPYNKVTGCLYVCLYQRI